MRLPPHLLESPFFVFASSKELVNAMGDSVTEEQAAEIERLAALGLPPIATSLALATMLGINPGLIWSFVNKTRRHYSHFTIPKGNRERDIFAPRVALKVLQKWLSVHFQRKYEAPDHVFGFVPGRSHIQAAQRHVGAQWVFSVDISNFFPTTPLDAVTDALVHLGYRLNSANLIARLCCLAENLAQGSPTSPVLSNICFRTVDAGLAALSQHHQIRLTRYADDIVFSGAGEMPLDLPEQVQRIIAPTPWLIAKQKTTLCALPKRLKVHGLLVHGDQVRLTKGYRNKVRAYRHMLATGQVRNKKDLERMQGHLLYANQVLAAAAD